MSELLFQQLFLSVANKALWNRLVMLAPSPSFAFSSTNRGYIWEANEEKYAISDIEVC